MSKNRDIDLMLPQVAELLSPGSNNRATVLSGTTALSREVQRTDQRLELLLAGTDSHNIRAREVQRITAELDINAVEQFKRVLIAAFRTMREFEGTEEQPIMDQFALHQLQAAAHHQFATADVAASALIALVAATPFPPEEKLSFFQRLFRACGLS